MRNDVDSLRGIRLILLYIAVLFTVAMIATAIQEGPPF